MRRRRLLAALAAGATTLAGCAGGEDGTPVTDPAGESADTTATATATPTPTATVRDVDLPVPGSALRQPLPKDRIAAIVDPTFAADWSGLETPEGVDRPLLPEDAPVVGVERDGTARAYPLRILNWHEVVNDRLGGPLLVTYCPLCGSSVVAERTVGGDPTVFGVSGKLWRNDLVMYDRATGSLWSQLLAAAIQGPQTGDRLSLLPSTLTSWGEWQDRHPGTEVLLPPPRSNTVRGRDATRDYFNPRSSSDGQLIGYRYEADEGLYGRTFVIGVRHDGVARAYPFDDVRDAGVVNDRVGGLPVAVTTTPAGSMAAYIRRVGAKTLRFETVDEGPLAAGGSRWERGTGRAVDGPHEGTTLDRANDKPPLFWEGWSNFNPDTDIYGE
jgi:hypothetical protein